MTGYSVGQYRSKVKKKRLLNSVFTGRPGLRRVAGQRTGQHLLAQAQVLGPQSGQILELFVSSTQQKLRIQLINQSINQFNGRSRWDEMGLYDIPAVLDYVLAETKQPKLSYVGHSMGCAIFFVAMIKYPEMNDKIDVMMALAPAASLAHMKSPIRYVAPYATIIEVGTCY